MKYSKLILNKVIVCVFIISYLLVIKSGFVVAAQTNPVSVSIEKSNDVYEVKIYINEDVLMNAFQFEMDYNGKRLEISDQLSFDSDFLNKYNGNKNALLTCKNRTDNDKCSIVFAGVHTDEKYAKIKKDTIISKVRFSTEENNKTEIEKILNDIKLRILVLEGKNGNIVPADEDWIISGEYKADSDNTTTDNQSDTDSHNNSNNHLTEQTISNDSHSESIISNNNNEIENPSENSYNNSVINSYTNDSNTNSGNENSETTQSAIDQKASEKSLENASKNQYSEKNNLEENANIASKKDKTTENSHNYVKFVLIIIFVVIAVSILALIFFFKFKK